MACSSAILQQFLLRISEQSNVYILSTIYCYLLLILFTISQYTYIHCDLWLSYLLFGINSAPIIAISLIIKLWKACLSKCRIE